MTIPAARQLVLETLRDLGVADPEFRSEATLLKNAQFAGRRFDFAGGYAGAWLYHDEVVQIWGPSGLLRSISVGAAEGRRAA